MEIRSKLWIEIDGQPVFGKRRRFLLESIDKHGSINEAAKEMNISYRKAWGYRKAMEERLVIKLIDRHKGGENGGGAVLIADARVFLKKYADLEGGMQEFIN